MVHERREGPCRCCCALPPAPLLLAVQPGGSLMPCHIAREQCSCTSPCPDLITAAALTARLFSKALARPRSARPPHTRRLRVGAWGGWKDGWCSLAGHELRFYAGAGSPPPPGSAPERSLELVGARLRAEHRQEVALAPPGGGPPVVLAFPDERQRDEWMVGLGQVPGLFRSVAPCRRAMLCMLPARG